MASSERVPEGGDRIWVPTGIHNGLILKQARENRPSPGNAGTHALENGIKIRPVTDKILVAELKKMGKEDLLPKRLAEEEAAAQ